MEDKQLTKDFSLSDFNSSDGERVPDHLIPSIQLVANNLQKIKDELSAFHEGEVSIVVTSGYRSKAVNDQAGSTEKSRHRIGQAVDFKCYVYGTQIDTDFIDGFIKCLIYTNAVQEGGLGQYPTFTHYDVRGSRARWRG